MNAYKITPRIFFLLVIFLLMQNLSADIQVTGIEAGSDFRVEYNRSLLYSVDCYSALAAVELNELYAFKGGLSLGELAGGLDIKSFTQGKIGPLFTMPLHFSLAWIYNGLPAYEVHSHTALPVVSLNGKWAGIAVGIGLRFTSFFGEPALFESMLSFSVYANFVNNKRLRLGVSWANFDDFYAGNMGAYSLRLNSVIRANEQWSFINDIELLQSGSVGLAANFYGIAYRGGIRVKW